MSEETAQVVIPTPPFSIRLLIRIIRAYQRISRFTPPTCRFMPSCSEYAAQAFLEQGLWKGSWLALCRLGRCNPFHPGGYDPVPHAVPHTETASVDSALSASCKEHS